MSMSFGRTNASGAAIGAWRFTHAAALPETVLHNTFLAVTALEAPEVILSDAIPPTAAAGALWFQIYDPTDGLALSSTAVPFRVMGAYQWDAAAAVWTLLDAYYTYLGAWRKIAGLPPVGTALADCTWAQIDRIGKAGKAAEYFCVGDTKDIVLNTAETLTLRIIGFDHDDLAAAGGGKAAMTFDTVDCLNTKHPLNPTSTTVGGYSGCAFYSTLNHTIWSTLPVDLRSVVKQVNKPASAGTSSAQIVVTADRIFLMSQVEVQGTVTNAMPGEGTQYAFFTSGGTKVKKATETAATWWNRSSGGSQSFCIVSAAGTASTNNAHVLNGVSFGLCV